MISKNKKTSLFPTFWQNLEQQFNCCTKYILKNDFNLRVKLRISMSQSRVQNTLWILFSVNSYWRKYRFPHLVIIKIKFINSNARLSVNFCFNSSDLNYWWQAADAKSNPSYFRGPIFIGNKMLLSLELRTLTCAVDSFFEYSENFKKIEVFKKLFVHKKRIVI